MNTIEIPLSSVRLSAAAESGDVGRAIGYFPNRVHRLPSRRQVEQRHVLFAWPSPSTHHPLPPRSGSAA